MISDLPIFSIAHYTPDKDISDDGAFCTLQFAGEKQNSAEKLIIFLRWRTAHHPRPMLQPGCKEEVLTPPISFGLSGRRGN